MYKTVVTPENRELSIIIPSDMVGKEIEISAKTVKKQRKKKFTLAENRAFYKKNTFRALKLKTKGKIFNREVANER